MKKQSPSMTHVLCEIMFHGRAKFSGREVLDWAILVRWGYSAVGLKVMDSVLQLIVDVLGICLKIFLFFSI